jgi:hypothetical protein
MSTDDVFCSCCGKDIADTPKENVWHGVVPYPGDAGTGFCRSCGGDLGFAACCFVDARIPVLEQALNPENKRRFLAMTYEEQARIIFKLVERGLLV